jgi:hypothetical protein
MKKGDREKGKLNLCIKERNSEREEWEKEREGGREEGKREGSVEDKERHVGREK